MKTLAVEFAPRRQLAAQQWVAIAIVLLAPAVQQGWTAWELHGRVQAAEQRLAERVAALQREVQAAREAAARGRVEAPYAHDASTVAKTAAFPLDRVLKAIESARAPGIKVSALDISAIDSTVKLELEFSDHEGLMRYLDEINAGEPKRRWTLVQVQGATTPGAVATATLHGTWDD